MTTNGRDLSPKETMGVLRRMAEDDARREDEEIARVEAMTREERQTFLRSRGIDVAKVRSQAAELRARLAPAGEGPPAKIESEARPSLAEAQPVAIPKEPEPAGKLAQRGRRPELTWVLAAAAAAAVAGGAAAAAHYLQHDEPPRPEPPQDKHDPVPPGPNPEDRLLAAASLRQRAAVACNAEDWSACLSSLDAARDRDPDGDRDLPWTALRTRAMNGIAHDEKLRRDEKRGP